jgi:hypothetical protein
MGYFQASLSQKYTGEGRSARAGDGPPDNAAEASVWAGDGPPDNVAEAGIENIGGGGDLLKPAMGWLSATAAGMILPYMTINAGF